MELTRESVIRISCGVLSLIIILFYIIIYLTGHSLPSFTELMVSGSIAYLLIIVAATWTKAPRKIGGLLLSLGMFMIMFSFFFQSMADNEEAMVNNLILDGFAQGYDESLYPNMTREEFISNLRTCDPASDDLLCRAYFVKRMELGSTLKELVQYSMNSTEESVFRTFLVEYNMEEDLMTFLDFEEMGKSNRKWSVLFFLFGGILFSASWFSERKLDRLVVSFASTIFFSFLSYWLTFKVMMYFFNQVPAEVANFKAVFIAIVRDETLRWYWPMIICGILWVLIHAGLFLYEKRLKDVVREARAHKEEEKKKEEEEKNKPKFAYGNEYKVDKKE